MAKKSETKLETNKEELDYFMGFFNCYKLCKDNLSKLESIYLHNYSTTKKIEDMYGLAKSLYTTITTIQNAMFDALLEKYGDRLDYDVDNDTWYIKDVSS